MSHKRRKIIIENKTNHQKKKGTLVKNTIDEPQNPPFRGVAVVKETCLMG